MLPSREKRQSKMTALGVFCLVAGTFGALTGFPPDSAVSGVEIVLLGVLWGGGGYTTHRTFDLVAGSTLGVVAVGLLLTLKSPPETLDASSIAGYSGLVLVSLGLLVSAAGYLTGMRHRNSRPWDVAMQGLVGLGILSLLVGFGLSTL